VVNSIFFGRLKPFNKFLIDNGLPFFSF